LLHKFDYKVLEDIHLRDYLLSFYLSRSKIYKLFLEKKVLVNGEFKNESFQLNKGGIVSISLDEEIDFKPIDKPIDILYEDDYLLIINKPSGIIIHSEDKNEESLSDYVAGYFKKQGLHLNVRYAHRLDKETTGVIVYCKDILSHAYMNYYISTHDIKREYRCLVQGYPKETSARLCYPIGSNRHDSKKMVGSKNGKEAITNFELLYKYKGYSLLRVILETGRTHQIWLHLSHYGNSLLGDSLYGGQMMKIIRVALHSYKIEFIHPVTKENISVVANVPQDMKSLMREE
jgi:23S rRNA pseudouridine1911/1915/1917 synthase